MENPTKMDDLVVQQFKETPISKSQKIQILFLLDEIILRNSGEDDTENP